MCNKQQADWRTSARRLRKLLRTLRTRRSILCLVAFPVSSLALTYLGRRWYWVGVWGAPWIRAVGSVLIALGTLPWQFAHGVLGLPVHARHPMLFISVFSATVWALIGAAFGVFLDLRIRRRNRAS